MIDWLYGIKYHFQQYFSNISVASAPIQPAFPHNHRRNYGQPWQEEWILSQRLSSILRQNIGQAQDQTSDLLF